MEATKKLTGKSVKKWLGNNAIIVLMLLVSLFVGIIHPNFFAPANLINLFKNVSIRYIIALGISGCLITTGNDLSAGRLAGFAACLACIFAQTEGAAGKFYPNMHTLPTPVVFILVIAICAIVGLCNGLVVSYLKVQPFIATLGMQQVDTPPSVPSRSPLTRPPRPPRLPRSWMSRPARARAPISSPWPSARWTAWAAASASAPAR